MMRDEFQSYIRTDQRFLREADVARLATWYFGELKQTNKHKTHYYLHNRAIVKQPYQLQK